MLDDSLLVFFGKVSVQLHRFVSLTLELRHLLFLENSIRLQSRRHGDDTPFHFVIGRLGDALMSGTGGYTEGIPAQGGH